MHASCPRITAIPFRRLLTGLFLLFALVFHAAYAAGAESGGPAQAKSAAAAKQKKASAAKPGTPSAAKSNTPDRPKSNKPNQAKASKPSRAKASKATATAPKKPGVPVPAQPSRKKTAQPATARPIAAAVAEPDKPAAPTAQPIGKKVERPAAEAQGKAVAWRFQGRELICDTDNGRTETVWDHVIHVRNGREHGDGSFENPYGAMDEALDAAARAEAPQLIYVWAGLYTGLGGRSVVDTNLIIAGSGTDVPLAKGRILPAQTKDRPVWQARDKNSPLARGGSSPPASPLSSGESEANSERHTALLRMADARSLRMVGLIMRGDEGNGLAISMGSRERPGSSGTLELSDCGIVQFGTGIFSSGPVTLLRNNTLARNQDWAIDSAARTDEAVLLVEKNTISDNGHGIRAHGGRVELRRDNLIEDNRGASVAAADIILGTRNIIQKNGEGLRADNTIRLKEENRIQDNSGDGANAERITLGKRNSISGNEGMGLAVAAPDGDQESRLELGDFNLILDNAKDGLYCGDSGTIRLGNDNQVLRNDFSDTPSAGSGIKSQSGDITLGNGNTVNRNGQCGILAPLGKVVLGEGNHIRTNNQSGIHAGEGVSLGGENVVTDNSFAGKGSADIQTDQKNEISRQSTDKVGNVR